MTHDLIWFTGLGVFALGLCACDLSEKSPVGEGSMAEHGASEGDDSATPGTTSTGGDTVTGDHASASETSSSASVTTSPPHNDEAMACSAIECADGIHLLLVPDGVVDGEYQIQVFALPDVDVAAECGFVVADGHVMESSCGVSSSDFGLMMFGFPQVFVEASFETMRIDVFRDGEIVGSLSTSPDYMEVAPNGPDCGPLCLQANVIVPLESPSPTACYINGEVWPHGASVDDPFSCNSCKCEHGQVVNCTDQDCPVPCPEGTGPGTRCTNCGPGDTCRAVWTGCLQTCNEGAECEGGSCIDGLCRHRCGDL